MSANTPEDNNQRIDHDLDVIAPREVRYVKINGQVLEMHELGLYDYAVIEKLQKENDYVKLLDALSKMIPNIEKANPTPKQLERLITMFMSPTAIPTPQNNSESPEGQKKGA